MNSIIQNIYSFLSYTLNKKNTLTIIVFLKRQNKSYKFIMRYNYCTATNSNHFCISKNRFWCTIIDQKFSCFEYYWTKQMICETYYNYSLAYFHVYQLTFMFTNLLLCLQTYFYVYKLTYMFTNLLLCLLTYLHIY